MQRGSRTAGRALDRYGRAVVFDVHISAYGTESERALWRFSGELRTCDDARGELYD